MAKPTVVKAAPVKGHTFKLKGTTTADSGNEYSLFKCSGDSCGERRVLRAAARPRPAKGN